MTEKISKSNNLKNSNLEKYYFIKNTIISKNNKIFLNLFYWFKNKMKLVDKKQGEGTKK